MSDGRYQDLVLHEVPKKTIEHGVGSLLRVWALGDKRAALTAPRPAWQGPNPGPRGDGYPAVHFCCNGLSIYWR
jgi:hypothetical protein